MTSADVILFFDCRSGGGTLSVAGRWAWRLFGRGGTLGVAAFWADAAHPRRQKHREMPPPGASAPAFAATVEPARARPHAKHPRQDACFGARWNACRGMCCFMHRFLISGPDLRIDVSFSPETSFCVQRFLISSPDLGITAGFCTFKPSYVQRFLISGGQFGNRCKGLPRNSPIAAAIRDFMGSI